MTSSEEIREAFRRALERFRAIRPVNPDFTEAVFNSIYFPEKELGELFHDVQVSRVFHDSKTFADSEILYSPEKILAEYQAEKNQSDFSLEEFVKDNFALPDAPDIVYSPDPKRSVDAHIEALWPYLMRQPSKKVHRQSSLLPLPFPTIVPGGRFREIYYWDTYFTMLGLVASGLIEEARAMIDNFAFLIEALGYIPNAARTYQIGRTQHPSFSLMVELLSSVEGDEVITTYLPWLEKEYSYWMDGESTLNEKVPSHRRVVRLDDGSVLNRYWDDVALPRPEGYLEDIDIAEKSGRNPNEVYREIRAACESGWDFTQRWFGDGKSITTIRITNIIPIDLNCLLYHLESLLCRGYTLKKDQTKSRFFSHRAEQRKRAIQKWLWDEEKGTFQDYDFVYKAMTDRMTIAMSYALFTGIAEQEQAQRVSQVIEKLFLKEGGVVTTLVETPEQWDAPNGWAPLQWITIEGLRRYKLNALASTIKKRWVTLLTSMYKSSSKLVEKYNVVDTSSSAGGGEYPLQDGFGWTNGVLLRLLKEDENISLT